MNNVIFYLFTYFKGNILSKKIGIYSRSLLGLGMIMILGVPINVQAQSTWFRDTVGDASLFGTNMVLPLLNTSPAANPTGVINQGLNVTFVGGGSTNYGNGFAGTLNNSGGGVGVGAFSNGLATTQTTFTYTLEIANGASITINSVSAAVRRTTPGLTNLASLTINGTNYRSNTIINSSTGTITTLTNTSWNQIQCTLPSALTFSNPGTTTVTISLVFDTPAPPGTSTSFTNRLDDFSIVGTVTPPASCSTPTAFNVTGGGSYCSGGAGVAVGLANS